MNISDFIASAILDLLSENGTAEIQRNDFAGKIGCVPSQINYVLTSRFKPEQGFIIESRRGGGGFIRIRRLTMPDAEKNKKAARIMHIVNSIGHTADEASSMIILQNMADLQLITHRDAELLTAAVSGNAFRVADPKIRPYLRADILKNTLLVMADKA